MLSRYILTMQPERPDTVRMEWAYPLYAALLEQLPDVVGQGQHDGERTGFSQYVRRRPDGALDWCVGLLGTAAEQAFGPALEELSALHLRSERQTLTVLNRQLKTIGSVEELLTHPQPWRRTLHFTTPTAFKHRKAYDILPTPERMLQSLIRQWNACIPDCPIEDTDGGGLWMLSQGLRCCGLQLWDCAYRLKGHPIPGIMGHMTLENRLEGFPMQLAHGLLTFAAFSGIGIKTTLGMGGITEA